MHILRTYRIAFVLRFLVMVLSGWGTFMGNSYATNFYISSSQGNDANSGTSASAPWKTIGKLNASFTQILPGDSVLFKRGDVFYGSLIVSKSGTFASRIVFGAYGSGLNPVISGFSSSGSWSSSGGNIWQTNIPYGGKLNTLLVNGVLQPKGRFPNPDDSNGGYLYYDQVNSVIPSITDTNATTSVNWAGADVVIRKTSWILDVCKVLWYSNGTINYQNPSGLPNTYYGLAGYGYFFQNDIRTLDRQGEWYFNPSTRVLNLFFGNTNPAGASVRFSTIDTLFSIGSQQYVTVRDLTIEGANQFGIYSKNGGDIRIADCRIQYCGQTGIYVFNVPNTTLERNDVYGCLSSGILVYNPSALLTVVSGNTVRNIATLPGMGESGDTQYIGIALSGNSQTIENNRVDSIGYNGINFDGNDLLIQKNFVSNFCQVKNDGGGIYTHSDNGIRICNNRLIRQNLVMNAPGTPFGTAARGTNNEVRGIYLDGGANNLLIESNSVANISGGGICMNNTTGVRLSKNIVFNSGPSIQLNRFVGGPLLRNITIRGNTVFSLKQAQVNLQYWNADLNNPVATDIQTDMRAIGDLDSNYYRDDVETPFDWFYHTSNYTGFVDPPPARLEGWKEYMAEESASRSAPGPLLDYRIGRVLTSNTVANGTFNTAITPTVFWAPNNAYTTAIDYTGKIDGTPCLQLTPTTSSSNFTLMYAPVGNVTTTKKYVLRFQTLGTSVNGVLNAGIRMTNAPFDNLVTLQKRYFGKSVTKHEILITAPSAAVPASYIIEIQQSSGITYIDNIEFFEVEASAINIENNVRFEYNENQTPRNLALDGIYYGVDGIRYQGNLTIQPYASIILIRDSLLSMPSSTLSASSSATAINCNGGTSTVTVIASGGTAPYTGTGTFVRSAGTHNFTVTDAAGASVVSTVTITQPSPLVVSVSSGTITVNGGSTTVTVSASGGTSPYTGTGTFTVTAGTYTYTVTDAKGCTGTQAITISQPPVLVASSSASAITCNGGSSTVTVSASGGTPPYTGTGSFSRTAGTYNFTVTDAGGASKVTSIAITQPSAVAVSLSAGRITVNGGSTTVTVGASGGTAPYTGTGTFTVTSGTYTYTVTDARGCTGTNTITVTQPAPLTASVSSTPINCNGGSSTVTVSATGGILPYTGTGSFSRTAGTYTFTVTDSVGTSTSVSLTLTQPTVLSAASSKTDVLCNGVSTGSITVTVSGGTTPYSFNWGGGITTQNRTALLAGSYTCTITDARGCTASASQTVTQPSALTAGNPTAPAITVNGGTTTITQPVASGGVSNVIVVPSRDITGLAGTLTVQGENVSANEDRLKAIDNNTSTKWLDFATANATTRASWLQWTLSGSAEIVNSYSIASANDAPERDPKNWTLLGSNNGGASWTTLDTRSGELFSARFLKKTYTFSNTTAFSTYRLNISSVNNPSNANSIQLSEFELNSAQSQTGGYEYRLNSGIYQSSNVFTNVAAGTHTISIRDANQCVITRTITLTDPTPLAASANAGQISCNGGSTTVTVSASGGVGPYTGTGTFTRTAGAHSFTVTDSRGSTSTVSLTISQPTPLVVSVSSGTIIVNGGSTTVTVSASGGTSPYTGTGTFTVTAGTYTYTVTDAKGCTVTQNITVSQPAVLTANSTATGIACNGGMSSITVSASGGISPYTGTGTFLRGAGTYSFTVSDANGVKAVTSIIVSQPNPLAISCSSGTINVNGGTTTVAVSASGGTQPYTGTGTFTVTAGTYTYTVRDANGCTASQALTITQPAVLTATSSATAISCNGGVATITVAASGGVAPYTGTGVFTARAGTYNYTVRDASGSQAITSIVISQPSALVATASAGTIATNGGSTSLTVSATGGKTPYTGTGVFNVTAGTYSYTVTDASGCSDTVTAIVTQPSSLFTATAASRPVNCFAGNTQVTVTGVSGLAPYSGIGVFTVSPGKGSLRLDINNPVPANSVLNYWTIGPIANTKNYVFRFSTLGTTANGSLKAYFRQTASPYSTLSSVQTAVYGTSITHHQFLFSNPVTQADASFVIEIQQSSGATFIDNIAIYESDALGNLTGTNKYAFGEFESGVGNIWSWTPSNNHIKSWDTSYRIPVRKYFTVTDASGKTAVASVFINQPSSPLSASSSYVSGVGNTFKVTVNGSGGTPPYAGTGTYDVAAGSYSYQVADSGGCIASTTIQVSALQKPGIKAGLSVSSASITSDNLEVNLYPNPTSGTFWLSVRGGLAIQTKYGVYSASGRKISEGILSAGFTHDLGSDWIPGIYFIRVLNGNSAKTIKAVKLGY